MRRVALAGLVAVVFAGTVSVLVDTGVDRKSVV